MSYEKIAYVVENSVAIIKLNRPHRKNALDLQMRAELWLAIDRARQDPGVAALLLTGMGDDFCSGGDISTMRPGELDAEAGRKRISPVTRGAHMLLELEKPVIAAVDGCAYGAGFSLALAADIAIATPRARFCLSFMRIGLIPDAAALFTLPRVIGWNRAKHLLYSAEEINGRTALEYGIVGELVEPANLQNRAKQIATAMTQVSPTAFSLSKSALLRTYSSDASAMADMEINGQGIAFSTQYHDEAAKRFLNRKPGGYRWPAPLERDGASSKAD